MLCRTDQFIIHYELQQPRQVRVLFFFFFLTGGHREEIILLLAAPTDNPKGEGLACCANEILENSSILT